MASRLRPAGWEAIVPAMLAKGDLAPDFRVGEASLHAILATREAVVFFFPKAFTPG